MRIAICLLVAACGSDGDSALARECIHSIGAGSLAVHGPDSLLLTTACAPNNTRIEAYFLEDGELSILSSVVLREQTRATRLLDLDGIAPSDTASIHRSALGYDAWRSGGTSIPRSIAYARPIEDVGAAHLNDDALPDVVVAGDGAIRGVLGTDPLTTEVGPGNEVELLAGKPFTTIAVLRRLGRPAIAYVAGTELGVAGASDGDALVYETLRSATIASGPALPLVVADLDDDNFDDVIAVTSGVFIYSSRHDRVLALDEPALAIAAGDLDGDGTAEPVFVSADGHRIVRIHVAPDGALTTELVRETDASALAVRDLDGDGRAEIAVVEGGLGSAGTRVVVY